MAKLCFFCNVENSSIFKYSPNINKTLKETIGLEMCTLLKSLCHKDWLWILDALEGCPWRRLQGSWKIWKLGLSSRRGVSDCFEKALVNKCHADIWNWNTNDRREVVRVCSNQEPWLL